MATGGAPGLRDRRCLAGSPADETGPPLLHHLPTHPPDHLQRPEADLHPQPDHGIDPGATDHARAAGIGRPQVSTRQDKACMLHVYKQYIYQMISQIAVYAQKHQYTCMYEILHIPVSVKAVSWFDLCTAYCPPDPLSAVNT